MRKRKLRAIALLLCTVLLPAVVPSAAVSAEESAMQIEEIYQDESLTFAAEMFKALGLFDIEVSEQLNITSLTRGRFAQMCYTVMTGKTGERKITQSDRVEDDGWLWIADKNAAASDASTFFYDVSSASEYWEAISAVAAAGIMGGGGDGYFEPNEQITGNECMKALVTMLGADFLADGNYPTGYKKVGTSLKLDSSLNIADFNAGISQRDAYVMLMNALCAEPYIPVSYGGDYNKREQQKDYLLMTYLYDVYKVTGIVDANKYTALNGETETGDDRISIDGTLYNADVSGAGSYLGYSVEAYYAKRKQDAEGTILYLNRYRNRELIVQADDIYDYSGGSLSYWSDDKLKTVKVSGNEDVIYNGKWIGDYGKEIFVPYSGYITFVDNDSNSGYDVINIKNNEIIVVGGVDIEAEIITDLYSDKVIKFKDTEYSLVNLENSEIGIASLSRYDVLILRRTLPIQGELYSELQQSSKTLVGEITEVNEEYIAVDGAKYEISKSYTDALTAAKENKNIDITELALGKYGTFYLTADDKIAAFAENAEGSSKYGYMIKVANTSRGLDESYAIKVYTEDGDFEIIDFGERVTLNGERVKDSALYRYLTSDDTGGAQMIRFLKDESGVLTDIDTAGARENGFVKSSASASGTCRKTGSVNGIFSRRPVCYLDNSSKIMYVPRNDLDDTDSYQISTEFTHDKQYTFNAMYLPREDSVVADLFIVYQDGAPTGITKQSTGVLLVDDVAKAFVDDEDCYSVSGYVMGSYVTYICKREKMYDTLTQFNKGDIVRCQRDGKGLIEGVEKVYDIKTHRMVNNSNISSSNSSNFVSEYALMHGMAWSVAAEQQYLNVMPYDYKTDPLTPMTDENELYTYLLGSFVVTIVDTSHGEPRFYRGSYREIVNKSDFNNGDELLLNTSWGNSKEVFIIR